MDIELLARESITCWKMWQVNSRKRKKRKLSRLRAALFCLRPDLSPLVARLEGVCDQGLDAFHQMPLVLAVSDIIPIQLTREIFERGGVQVGDRPAAPAIVLPFGRNVRDRSYFEATISGEWKKSVGAIVRIGQLLNEAHDELSQADYNKLRLPFSQHTAFALRRIARHPVFRDPLSHGSLPPSWRTLDMLITIVSPELIRVAIADGRINPELERKDIRRALGLPPKPPGSKRKGNGQTHEKPLDAVVTWAGFSTDDKRAILESEGRVGLAKLLSPKLMRELAEHLIPLQKGRGKRGR